MPNLKIIIGSTRPGRISPPIAQWVAKAATAHGGFDVELVDLLDHELPLLDEPAHPRLAKYQHEHTRRWASKVAQADAFVFVTPEYNSAPSPSLLNAVDYLYHEWAYKPVGFVSYGGLSGGLRSVQVMKQVVAAVRMTPIPEGVAIPLVMQFLAGDQFAPPPPIEAAAAPMFDELLRWTEALHELRMGPPPPPPPGPPGPPPGAGPGPRP